MPRPKGSVIGFWGLSYFFWRRLQATTREVVPHGGVYPEPRLNAMRTT